jgi:hypothetical protein
MPDSGTSSAIGATKPAFVIARLTDCARRAQPSLRTTGATSRQLMAIFGWDTLKEAERYTRGAEQKLLAEGAMHLLENTEAARER